MLKNHLLFAIRLFKKEQIYSFLNILGLTLGISVGIVLFLYLQHELGYDKHFEKHDQIYRFTNHMTAPGAEFNTAVSSRRLGPVFKQELPEVIEYVRFINTGRPMVSSNENDVLRQFYEESVYLTDSTIFKLFDHEFYEGYPSSCLAGPGKVVLTKSIAEKYFGDQPAVGKRLTFNDNDSREVTAVISDLPENTHLRYEILLSQIPVITWDANAEPERVSEVYWNPGSYTYLLMPKGYDTDLFYDKFPMIYEKTFKTFGDRIQGSVDPQIQRIDRIHFDSDKGDDQPTGNMAYVYTFVAVGIFIIVLACINYMNMATARAATRTGEMGVRKVLGYSRLALFGNVMIEALLLAFFALVLANIVTYLLFEVTSFNSLIERDLSLNYLSNPALIFGVLSITLLIGVISGIYPALYIPAVPVVTALRGSYKTSRGNTLFRQSLITFQFVISLFVIICTVLMDQQIKYMMNKDLGLDTEHVVLLNVRDSLTESRITTIKNELMQNPNILGTTNAYGVPGTGGGGPVMMVERDSGMYQQHVNSMNIGKDFLDLMDIEIVEGRAFRENTDGDFLRSYLVNEAGAKALWNDNALGKKVRHFHGTEDYNIIGVYKDFNYESLHNPINPLFLILNQNLGGTLYVKIRGENMQETLSYIEDVWTRFDTNHPYDYRFLDNVYAEQYQSDQVQKRMISILSYISIIVSLFGLIGLSAFTASKKAKEISIRKVLGANTTAILILFSKGYMKLILIAFLLSIPLSIFVINKWLTDFAYRMTLNGWYFILPGILVLGLGLLTVALQSLRSASTNPIQGLRKE